jgi:prophage antirepressor-like protein
MSNSIIAKQFEDYKIRMFTINNELYFVGIDIANALDYKDAPKAITNNCKEYIKVHELVTVGSLHINEINGLGDLDPKTNLITEKDVYRLIMRSNKPEAEKFQDWVYDVITEIRKTGSYNFNKQLTISEQLLLSAQLLVKLEQEHSEIKTALIKQDDKLNDVYDRLDNIETAVDYFTIIGYFRYKKKKSIPLKQASVLGKKVTNYCKINNIAMGNIPDQRFGNVNSYPLWVLEQLIP